jgi:hypothetical protein
LVPGEATAIGKTGMMASTSLPPREKAMRTVLACLCIAAAPAWAQAPSLAVPSSMFTRPAEPCADCGVVRSVRTVVKESKPGGASDVKPSGLVASIPLGAGAGKPQVSSSTRIGRDAVHEDTTYEVVVQLEDGRFRVLTSEEHEWQEGDRVRVEGGRLLRRD